MDVVISKDLQVVVSHEPWMNDLFCTRPDNDYVESNSQDQYNLFKMDYAEIATYDCGKRGNLEFPSQKKIAEHKPLLNEVLTKVETFLKENKLSPISYNIEIKSEPEHDHIFQPEPKTFVNLLYQELKKHKCLNRIYLQSFDVRILKEIKKNDPKMRLALLVENDEDAETNINRLGFTPEIYSPYFYFVNQKPVSDLHEKKIKLIPWTVNEISDMKNLLELGVDGIITDYPDRLIKLVR